jgi:Tol biopolymer transport system component
MYNIQTGEDDLIPDLVQDQKLTYVMADLSHDGKRLAITSSPTAQVKVYTISSWAPFTIELEYELPVLAYWPAISPDGKYFAFMQFDWVEGHPGNRKVTIMDLQTGETDNIEDLESFTEKDFYLSDWIN